MFNEQRFFDCHETLEPYYQESEDENKPFLEGLIQLAAAFRLYRDFGEVKGPVRMIRQALIRLENYQPSFLHIRVKDLSLAAEAWVQAAEHGSDEPRLAIPKIQVQRLSLFS